MTVDNKIVLITGANRGIGHSIMSAFINAGYIVVGTSRSDDGVKKINDTIGDPSKGCGVKMDVTSENDIQSANKLIRSTLASVAAVATWTVAAVPAPSSVPCKCQKE